MRAIVSSALGAQAVTFTSSESYERVMNARRVRGAGVEPDTEPGRAAVRGDARRSRG